MDTELANLIGLNAPGGKEVKPRASVKFVDMAEGAMEIARPEGPTRYALKPLKDLYAPGTDSPSVDPQDDKYMPLFLSIEGEIAQYYENDAPSLSDGAVGLVLDQLALSPEAPDPDPLAQQVQMALRFCLSLNDYSRQEVRAAIRKIRKSVERHSKVDGRRGYLNFIVKFYG